MEFHSPSTESHEEALIELKKRIETLRINGFSNDTTVDDLIMPKGESLGAFLKVINGGGTLDLTSATTLAMKSMQEEAPTMSRLDKLTYMAIRFARIDLVTIFNRPPITNIGNGGFYSEIIA
jgi:hypothetical protein